MDNERLQSIENKYFDNSSELMSFIKNKVKNSPGKRIEFPHPVYLRDDIMTSWINATAVFFDEDYGYEIETEIEDHYSPKKEECDPIEIEDLCLLELIIIAENLL